MKDRLLVSHKRVLSYCRVSPLVKVISHIVTTCYNHFNEANPLPM